MVQRISHLLPIALIATATAGCGATAPSRFYTLTPTAKAGDAPATRCAVLVGPVSVPPAVDRPQFVVQVAPNRIELDEFNRWAAPLHDSIARTVAGDLGVLLGTRDVAVAPVANFDPSYRVTIDVQGFETVPGESVLIDAVWIVNEMASGAAHPGHTRARKAVQGTDYDELAAAHSRALAEVSADIAAAIRDAERRRDSISSDGSSSGR